ncbi:MAG: hypothetical protein ABSE51_08670 [Terracidiphilus sp.]|jgi:hypothetical protein
MRGCRGHWRPLYRGWCSDTGPGSVESVLAWASRLQDRFEYVIVENATNALADFTYWRSTEPANRFREAFTPETLQMEFRLRNLKTLSGNMESNSGRLQAAGLRLMS